MDATATTSQQLAPPSPHQAGPLPVKRGEFGYKSPAAPVEGTPSPGFVLTDVPLDAPDYPVVDLATVTSRNQTSSEDKPARAPIIFGMKVKTILSTMFVATLALTMLGGWIATGILVSPRIPNFFLVFLIHLGFLIGFASAVAGLERYIFKARAERWAWVHRNDILPTHSRPAGLGIGFIPWSRPALPTYASALGTSGARTGDVEDGRIAVAPPPLYGRNSGDALVMSSPMAATFNHSTLTLHMPQESLSRYPIPSFEASQAANAPGNAHATHSPSSSASQPHTPSAGAGSSEDTHPTSGVPGTAAKPQSARRRHD